MRISPSGDILQIDGEWEKNKLVIGDFKEIDANGNLTDYGTMNINKKYQRKSRYRSQTSGRTKKTAGGSYR